MCIIRLLFKGACWVAAVMMVLYWVVEFSIKDEDLSIVDYKTFYQERNIMLPEVSLCIENPFIEDKLIRVSSTKTQTLKTRFERFTNLDTKFILTKTQSFKNKHVLLIDDVITTGATLEACAKEFTKIEGCKVSVLTMAYTE